jgi:hypothetical protein
MERNNADFKNRSHRISPMKPIAASLALLFAAGAALAQVPAAALS